MPVWTVDDFGIPIAAVAATVISFVWYMPAVAGKAWSAATGISAERMKATMRLRVVFAFGMALLQAIVLSTVITVFHRTGIGAGMIMSLFLWLLILSTTLVNLTYEARPLALFWIYGGNSFITFAVMGAILGGWREM